MADSELDDLTAALALDGTEEFYVLQGAADRKVTGTQIKTLTSASPALVTPNLGTPSAGVLTSCTGTASGLTAGNVTTNANLTGPITSSGNATSIASQTGTGTKFVVDTSPVLVTPLLGTPTSGVLTNCTGLPAVGGGTGQSTYVKGDILASPGSNTLNKLTVGTDTFVLTADSASTNGVKWAAGGGGVTVNTTAITGGTTLRLLYDNAGTVGETSGVTFTATGALTLSDTLYAGDGAALTPSLTFAGATGTGFFRANDELALTVQGTNTIKFRNNVMNFSSAQVMGWSSTIPPSTGITGDTLLGRAAAATLRQGDTDDTTPVAQNFTPQSVIAGTTDTAGKDWTFIGSKGTGTAAGGNIIDKTAFSAKSTGSGQGTAIDRRVIVAKGKVLTDATPVSLFEIALPTLAMCGGQIEATVVCTDGTEMQSFTQTISYSAINKGGVYTKSITASTGDKSVSGGSTIANTWTLLDGTNKVTVQLSSDTSLTPSSNAFLAYYSVKNNSEQATTIL